MTDDTLVYIMSIKADEARRLGDLDANTFDTQDALRFAILAV